MPMNGAIRACRTTIDRWKTSGVLGLLLLVSGCTRPGPFPDLYPLSGTVKRADRVVNSGGMIFLPESNDLGGLVVNATISEDGTFSAHTLYSGREGVVVKSGAPVGRYKVIYHPPSNGAMMGLDVEVEQRVTVEAGENSGIQLTLPKTMPTGTGIPRDDDPTSRSLQPIEAKDEGPPRIR
jgi:hypothetical protein